jgi:hypothetical protein
MGYPVASASKPLAVACPQQELNLPAWEQLLHNHEQPSANGVFQEVAWPEQTLHLSMAQQLHYHDLLQHTVGRHRSMEDSQDRCGRNSRCGGRLGSDHITVSTRCPMAGSKCSRGTRRLCICRRRILRYHEQTMAANDFLSPETSAARFPREAMMDPAPLPHGFVHIRIIVSDPHFDLQKRVPLPTISHHIHQDSVIVDQADGYF